MPVEKPPAVVVGAGINGLGVARSLARANVPVWLLDSDPHRPEMSTRAARPLRIASLHGAALIDELVRLGTTRFANARPVLLLTQEESVKLVSHQRERLLDHYRIALPPKELVDALQHKDGFQQLAEQHGAPIPPLVHVTSSDDLPALERLRYPAVVKPGERNAAYSRQFKKAYRVEDAAEALALVRRILPVMPDVVVQEWTEGPDSNLYFCLQYLDRQGQVAASFTGRKIRSWPPHVGGTASCTAAPEAHEELTHITARFFQKVGVIGMASMEYKRDARSGAFRMVEPTIGRTDYQEEVATLNGVNLPYAAWCSELGLFAAEGRASNGRHSRAGGNPVTLRHGGGPRLSAAGENSQACGASSVPARRPVAWRVRSEDLQSAAAQNQSARDGFEGASRVVDALWRASDPMPSLRAGSRRIKGALGTRTSRLVPGLRTARSKP